MTTDDELVVIPAGTGKTGRRVAARLTTAGVAVRAVSRSTEPRFDWHDPDTWEKTLTGATAMYLPPPDEPFPVSDFVSHAVDAGVRRVVALSGRRMELLDPKGDNPMSRTEQAVRDCGAQWTILQANNFNQNFDEGVYRDAVLAGELSAPLGGTREPFIDADDIAEVAVAALTRDGHAGRLYELTGPRGLTFAEAADALARATGRTVRFRDVSATEHVAELRQAGLDEGLIEFLDAMYAVMRAGHIAEPTDHVRRILGREPTDFARWAERAAAAGAWG